MPAEYSSQYHCSFGTSFDLASMVNAGAGYINPPDNHCPKCGSTETYSQTSVRAHLVDQWADYDLVEGHLQICNHCQEGFIRIKAIKHPAK